MPDIFHWIFQDHALIYFTGICYKIHLHYWSHNGIWRHFLHRFSAFTVSLLSVCSCFVVYDQPDSWPWGPLGQRSNCNHLINMQMVWDAVACSFDGWVFLNGKLKQIIYQLPCKYANGSWLHFEWGEMALRFSLHIPIFVCNNNWPGEVLQAQ